MLVVVKLYPIPHQDRRLHTVGQCVGKRNVANVSRWRLVRQPQMWTKGYVKRHTAYIPEGRVTGVIETTCEKVISLPHLSYTKTKCSFPALIYMIPVLHARVCGVR